MTKRFKINRAPMLTLWGAAVARRLGFDWKESLTFGRAVAGLNAYSKGVSLGLFTPAPKSVKEEKKKAKTGAKLHVALMHRAVPVKQNDDVYHGGYPIPANGTTRGSIHLMLEGDLMEKCRHGAFELKIADQFGHWHKIKFTDVPQI